MFFGGGQRNAEEDVYDYDYSSAGNFKTKSFKGGSDAANSSGGIAPFSPIPKPARSNVSFSDQQRSSTGQGGGAGGDSALERAKNIMDRYSGKQAKPAPFKSRPMTFDEDDISISGEDDEEETEENSDVNVSESYAASDSYVEKPQVRHSKNTPLLSLCLPNSNHSIDCFRSRELRRQRMLPKPRPPLPSRQFLSLQRRPPHQPRTWQSPQRKSSLATATRSLTMMEKS